MEIDSSQVLQMINLGGVLNAIVTIAMAWFVAKLVGTFATRMQRTFTASRLVIEQAASYFRFTIFVLAAFLAVGSIFSLSKEVLAVLGGTIVVTVGLVLKDQVSSVIAGVMILVEKPFRVGDRVSFAGFYGEIRSIGLRSVRLATLDDNEITIPNNKFLSDPVSCANSGALTMLVQQDFYIGIDQDYRSAKRVVENALTSSPFFYSELPWVVLVNVVPLNDMMAVRLRAKAYIIELRYEKAFESDVTQRVLDGFEIEGVLAPAVVHRPADNARAPRELELRDAS